MERKCLVLAMEMSHKAAGIVFKRLALSMQKHLACDFICPRTDEEARRIARFLPCTLYRRLHYKIERIPYRLQGYKLTDVIWSRINLRRILKYVRRNDYDAVISFVHADSSAPLILGDAIKKKTGLPWIVYSVDAIPTPVEWSNDLKLRERSLKHLRGHILKADAFFSANPVMLEYEKRVFPDFSGKTGVVLTPTGSPDIKPSVGNKNGQTTFLYAGFIQGPRKIDSLLAAFEKFLEKEPSARLVFVGNWKEYHFEGFSQLISSGAVERHSFTKDIESFYRRADVLVDLNANVENDVFLSSKVCNYLSYPKPILAISQDGSPVRAMMSGYNSIIHSHCNSEEIFKAMEAASAYARHYQDDRQDLRRSFLPDVVAESFCKDIESVLEGLKIR